MRRPDSTTRPYKIPDPSLRRLPLYYHFLQALLSTGVTAVSTTVIATALNLDPTQVRKDLELTGIVGKPRVGYPLETLVRWIEKFLGWHEVNEAVLVGTGSLGTALLGYQKFRDLGFRVVAAFDIDPAKIGHAISGTTVRPIEDLGEICESGAVRLGVITTPSAAAQSVADRMVLAGIRAIWNFAPVYLRVPEYVVVQNEDLYHSLAFLSFRLERALNGEPDPTGPSVGLS